MPGKSSQWRISLCRSKKSGAEPASFNTASGGATRANTQPSWLWLFVFGYYFKLVPGLVARAGAVMTIAGALFVAYQLHRRASSETAPAATEFEQCLGFHRRGLERQRDALENVWSWYLGPLIPGLAVFIAGTAITVPHPDPLSRSHGRPFVRLRWRCPSGSWRN